VADLITCPKCGLSQSAKHAFCARCDCSFATTGPAPAITDDLLARGSALDTGEYDPAQISDQVPTVQASAPTPSPRDRRERTPTGRTPTGRTPTGRTPTGRTPTGRTPTGGTPTGSGTPTDRDRPISSGSMPEAEDPAGVSTTIENMDAPAGPAWGMPGRPGDSRTDSFPAPPLRKSGREKRSLSARSRNNTPDAVPTLEREPTPAPSEPPPRARSHPGSRPGSDLRGRPPGKLFASENSLPPGDPLMAALVSGEALRADSFPDIDFGTSHPAPSDEPPPVHDYVEDLAAPAPPQEPIPAEPSGPRVVAPSRGRRSRSSIGHRSRPGGLLPDGPSAKSQSSPEPLAQERPAIERQASAPGRSLRTAADARTSTIPPAPRAQRGSIPAVPRPDPKRSSLIDGRAPDDLPLPPPPDLPDNLGSGVDPATVRRGVKIAALLAAVLVASLAARDVSAMIADIGSLRAAMNANIRSDGMPTPDLPRMLDRAVQELDLGDQMVARWATISAESDRFDVGVEIQHSVVGLPQRTRVSRDGEFLVTTQLKTLEFYLAEWDLDDEGRRILTQDKERRELRP
jgi:hypothetical protein